MNCSGQNLTRSNSYACKTVCSIPATACCLCCGNLSLSTHKSACWPAENRTSSFCLCTSHCNRKKHRMLNSPHSTFTSTTELVKGEENSSIKQLSDVLRTELRDSLSPTRGTCPTFALASSVKPSTPAEAMQQCPNEDQHSLSKPGISMETNPSELKDGISPTSTGVQLVLQQPTTQSAAQFQVAPPHQVAMHFRSAMDATSPESPASVRPS